MCDQDHFSEEHLKKYSRRDVGTFAAAVGIVAMLPRSAFAVDVIESEVTIRTPDGECDAYFVAPTTGAHAAVLVWPDIFGLPPAMRQMGKRLAEDGYSVLVVNPCYRQQKAPTAPQGAQTPVQQLFPMMRALTATTHTTDAKAFIAWLDARAEPRLFPSGMLSLGGSIGVGFWMIFFLAISTTPGSVYVPLLLQALHGVPPATAGYLTWVRTTKPYWQVLTVPVSGAMLDRTHAVVDAYLRSVRADEALNADPVRVPENMTMTGGPKFAGLCDSAVPVWLGQKPVGYLQTGQVFLRKPSRAQFSRMTRQLMDWGLNADLGALEEAYFHGRVLTPKQYEAMLRLLAMFAQHLSLVANRVLVQQEKAESPVVARAKQYVREHQTEAAKLDAAIAANLKEMGYGD